MDDLLRSSVGHASILEGIPQDCFHGQAWITESCQCLMNDSTPIFFQYKQIRKRTTDVHTHSNHAHHHTKRGIRFLLARQFYKGAAGRLKVTNRAAQMYS